jgi:site-specific DNA-methyltransferase (adenine-specific)
MTPYYQNEYITLYQGDCLEIMPQLNIKVNAVISDIPYFQIVKNNWDNQWNSIDDYLIWCNNCFKCCDNILKENGSLLIFTGRQINRKICNELDNLFYEQRIIIWARKRTFNNTRGKALASGYEPICYYTKHKNNFTFNNIKIKTNIKRPEYTTGYLKDGVTLSDVWSDISALQHNSKEKVNHPTQKPIKLMERCIKFSTNENDTILDFTAGSGTTGIAAMNFNRKCVLIEKEKEYCDIIVKRLKENESSKSERIF